MRVIPDPLRRRLDGINQAVGGCGIVIGNLKGVLDLRVERVTQLSLLARLDDRARFSRNFGDRTGAFSLGFLLGFPQRRFELSALLLVFLKKPHCRSNNLTNIAVATVRDAVAGELLQRGT